MNKIKNSTVYGITKENANRLIGDNAMVASTTDYVEYISSIENNLSASKINLFYTSIKSGNLREESILGNLAFINKMCKTHDKLNKSLTYLNCHVQVAEYMIEDKNPIIALFNYIRNEIVSKITPLGDEWEHLFGWVRLIPITDTNEQWMMYSFLDDEDFTVYRNNTQLLNDVKKMNMKIFTFFDKHLAENLI